MENELFYIILYPIFRPLGWLILYIRYRDKSLRQKVLVNKYNNRYPLVVFHHLFLAFTILLVLGLLALIVLSPFMKSH